MGRSYDRLAPEHEAFIAQQRLFFVATAPLSADGHLNLSPKGHDAFRILDAEQVAYLDLVGSGVETIAHVKENGRIVILFCAFDGAPKILRLHGQASVIEPGSTAWDEHRPRFFASDMARSIILIKIARVSDSCGYGVPLYEFRGARQQLFDWGDRKGPAAIRAYSQDNNRRSIDGLLGLSACGD